MGLINYVTRETYWPMLTVGSLFSGIGGLDLGLERAGMEIKWQTEIDPYARRVLAKHWPDIPCYEDVRTVHHGHHQSDAGLLGPRWCRGCVTHVDVLCGGFPCQDISNAGKRAGIDGARSGLWSEYARLIDEIRPSWVIIENVPALRSRGLGRVLSDLSARGYDAEWDGISAAHLGAPHQRDRVFVVAYPHGAGRVGVPRVFDGSARPSLDNQTWNFTTTRGASGRVRVVPPPHVGRVADGLPDELDRLRVTGNAVVPQVAEFVGRLVMQAHAITSQVER